MKVGDLVKLREGFPLTLKVFRVLWSSDLELERLYEDELEFISEAR